MILKYKISSSIPLIKTDKNANTKTEGTSSDISPMRDTTSTDHFSTSTPNTTSVVAILLLLLHTTQETLWKLFNQTQSKVKMKERSKTIREVKEKEL